MSNRFQVITFCHDIAKYPPIITLINNLRSRGERLIIVGYCSNVSLVNSWLESGFIYKEALGDVNSEILPKKILHFIRYRKVFNRIIESYFSGEIAKVWFFGSSAVFILHGNVKTTNSIVYHLETPHFKVPIKYRLISPTINYIETMRSAKMHVACEYNRACITKYFFGLKELPVIVPNKNTQSESINKENLTEYDVLKKIEGKKAILYQGIFNYPERRLDELCESVDYLPNDFVVVLMGGGEGFIRLKEKYASSRVLFQNYVPFPDHMRITKSCFIGFLSYFPEPGNINSVLNTLYCAPNKIYEYACMGLPFISNDLPAIRKIEKEDKCCVCVSSYTAESIASAILKINDSYDTYSRNAKEFYENENITIFED